MSAWDHKLIHSDLDRSNCQQFQRLHRSPRRCGPSLRVPGAAHTGHSPHLLFKHHWPRFWI